MPSPALIEKVLKENTLYNDNEVIIVPHVFVFATNDAGIAGTDSGIIAKRHYKRPASPFTGMHENHMGATYGISLKKSNMVTSRPFAEVSHDMMVMYYLAEAEKGERKWVLPNFARNVDRDNSAKIIRLIKDVFINKKDLFIVPSTWLHSVNPYFS